MSKSIFKRKRFWLGLAITIFFLWMVFRKVDMQVLTNALVQANYIWLVPGLIVYLLGYLVRAVRWKYLMKSIKPLSWQRLYPPLILGFMVNNVLPARAGEFVRAYIVGKREGISKSSVFATVVMQRVYDGLVMVLFAVVVLGFFKLPSSPDNFRFVELVNLIIKLTAVLFVLLFAFFFAMITWKEWFTRVLSRLTKKLPNSLRQPVEHILHSFIDGLSVLRNRRDSLLALGFSVLAWSGESATYYFVLRAFDVVLPLYAAVMLMALVNLGIMLPSSPGYIGPFEFFGVSTLLLFGVDKSVSLPCILVIHAMVWLPITLWGFYYMWTMKLSFREMDAASVEVPANE
ncbi:flippase-like domain-containing protein [bacterium]|nr:flippase-like domain-containing protein [bacterium]